MNRTRTALAAAAFTAVALSGCGANTPTAAPPAAPLAASASTDTPTVDPTVTPPPSTPATTPDTPPATTTTTDTPAPPVDPTAAPSAAADTNTPAPPPTAPPMDPTVPAPPPVTHAPGLPIVPVTHAPPVDPAATPPPAAPQPAPNPAPAPIGTPAPAPVLAPPVAAAPPRPAPVVQPPPAPVVQVDGRSNCQRALDARPGWTSGAMASGWGLSCVDRLSIPAGGFAEGATSAGRRIIEVRQGISYQDAAYTWAHESGHAYDWTVLTPAARSYVVSQVGGDWPRGMTSSGPYLQQDQEAWGNAFAACGGYGNSALGYKQIPCGVVARAEAIAQGR